jgi:hypothetical protein
MSVVIQFRIQRLNFLQRRFKSFCSFVDFGEFPRASPKPCRASRAYA